MAEYYYIATPYDDLEAPHWRLVEAETGGAEAIVFALRLRGLAAKSNSGGLVCLHNGEPMTLGQICTYLGYSPLHLKRSLDILVEHDLARPGDKGIFVTEPVLLSHLERVADNKMKLLLEPKKPGPKPTGSAKTGAERQRIYRHRRKNNNANGDGDNSVTSTNGPVTHDQQHAEMIDNNVGDAIRPMEVKDIKFDNNNCNPVTVDIITAHGIYRALASALPAYAIAGLMPIAIDAVTAGHSIDNIKEAAQSCKGADSPSGLCLKKLRAMAQFPPPPIISNKDEELDQMLAARYAAEKLAAESWCTTIEGQEFKKFLNE